MDETETPLADSPAAVFCGGCGYDLRGLVSDRCPECGLGVAADRGGGIPWERRRELRFVRTFLATMMLAMFHPDRLARACVAPVDVRSARWFRRVVVLLAWLAIVTVMATAVETRSLKEWNDAVGSVDITPGGPNSFWEPALMWTAGAQIYPVLPIGALLALLLATGITHWFYVPRLPTVRQNRAMAISYYQCAPLALLPIPAALAVLLLVLTAHNQQLDGPTAAVAKFSAVTVSIFGLLILFTVWIIPVRALQKATQCGLARVTVVGLGLQMQGLLAMVLGLGLFPAAVGLVWIMIDSLRP